MLSEHPVDVMLLATDLDAANHLYANKVALAVLIDTAVSRSEDRRVVRLLHWPVGAWMTHALD